MAVRLLIAVVIAVLVNLGLFTLMQQMTTAKGLDLRVLEDIRILDFIRLQREETPPETKRRQPPDPPPPPEEPPPPLPAVSPQVQAPQMPTPMMNVPRIEVPLTISGGPYLGNFQSAPVQAAPPGLDDEVIPLVRVPPNYPRTAQRRGIEGVVTIEFTITRDGTVRDPKVIQATPEGVFDREALNAILRWKFRPKLVDGQAVERQATQEIEFKMAR